MCRFKLRKTALKRVWQRTTQVWFCFCFFKEKKKEKKRAQTDTVSIKAGHASSSYASEVYSSGAAERANEGIKKRI